MPVMNYLNTCIFDHGAVSRLAKTLKGQGVSRPFIVTDGGIKAAGLLGNVLDALGTEPADVFDETVPNPTEVQAKVAATRYGACGADGIVAIGGGSSMDMAKMVGLIATHEGPYDKYAAYSGGARYIQKIPPLIAIPTTAGTGSEASVGTVVVMENGRKETIVSPNLIPDVAICDPDLTMGLPAHLTAATGMDAATHCIEAVLAPAINPPAEGVGYDGVRRALKDGWLKRAVADGKDPEARWNMMMASYEGALAFVKGLGGVHALSHAAGRLHHKRLHHGTLNAVFLPHLLWENEGAADAKYERLREAMGLQPGSDLGDAVQRLNSEIGIPETLGEMGLEADDGPGIVEFALKDLAHVGNAKPLDQGDYERIYEAALG
ncbi:MAG: iron-containing alcohol dehydrogenase [Pseudomonadota bacterium]